jgi:predicted transcriptional regulator
MRDGFRTGLRDYWPGGLAVAVGLIVVSYGLFPQLIVSLVNLISYEVVQVAVSASLLLVTAVYAYETKQQTEQLEKDRKQKFRPIIRPTVEVMGVSSFSFAVENSGKGAAYDLEAEWWMAGEESDKVTWRIPLLSPGERRRFSLPTDGATTTSQVDEKYRGNDYLHFEAGFEDGLGNSFEPEGEGTSVSLKLTDTMASREGASEYLEKDEMKKIRKEFEELNKNIDTSSLFGENDTEIRSKIRSTIISLLRNLGPLTIRELKEYSGLTYDEVTVSVHHLSNLGMVDYDGSVNITSQDNRDTEIQVSDNLENSS